jgi:hypothetical protein
MKTRLHGVKYAAGALGILAVAALVLIGCGGVNPFLSTQFWLNSNIEDLLQPNVTVPAGEEPTDTGTLTSVCDLDPNDATLRTIQVTVQSESQQYVKFSMTFVASTGTGGFVCADELQDYLNAGYSYRGSTVFGCDTVSLGGGQLIAMEFGINQGAGATLPPATYDSGTLTAVSSLALRRRDTLSQSIPLPQIIIFGNSDPSFECVGGSGLGDLCSQRGFVYTNAAGVTVGKSAEAWRIQGTLCNENYGSAPEWRLDRTLNDGQILPYQYAHGGEILVTVKDRSGDLLSNGRSQAVWTVTNSGGTQIQFPDP